MNPNSLPIRIVFFQVRKPALKISRLIETVTTHFDRKEPFLISTEDEKAVQYIDELLWKYPSTSFLPHQASEEPIDSLIAITRYKKNINQARFVFNLCPTPLMIEGAFRMIYEFEDLTSPARQQLSIHRFDAYKKAGYLIEAR